MNVILRGNSTDDHLLQPKQIIIALYNKNITTYYLVANVNIFKPFGNFSFLY